MKIGFTIVACMFIALITLLAVLAFKNKSANGELFHEFDVNEPAPVRVAKSSPIYVTLTTQSVTFYSSENP